MSDRIRAALVCLTLDHGGAEHHLLKLATALRETPVDPVVVALNRDAGNVLKGQFDAAGVPVQFPPYSRDHPGVVTWLARLLTARRFDVAHSFLWRPDAMLAFAATGARFRPVICSERGDRVASRYWTAGWRVRRMIDRTITFRKALKLVSNSTAGADAAVRAGCPRDKTLVIHNWVELPRVDAARARRHELRRACGFDDRTVVVGFVGRLIREKGAHDFVTLAAALTERLGGRRVAFLMVGEGPLRVELEARAAAAGLSRRLIFSGAVDEPFGLIHAMDLGVLCSPSESLPNVLLEFLACGKPVVATDVGGIADFVVDGDAGRLVPPGDPERLVAACASLLASLETLERMGSAARRSIERRAMQADSVARYVDLYSRAARAV